MCEWISVKDKLPVNGQHIIFHVDVEQSENIQQKIIKKILNSNNKFVGSGYAFIEKCETGNFLSFVSHHKNGSYRIFNAEDDFITHWMPLPYPPED